MAIARLQSIAAYPGVMTSCISALTQSGMTQAANLPICGPPVAARIGGSGNHKNTIA